MKLCGAQAYYTQAEAQAYLGVTRSWFEHRLRTGELPKPSHNVGESRLYYSQADLKAMQKSKRVAA